jgi:hypothetical protein
MRNPGLEPGSLAALEPESSASANSASSACGIYLLFYSRLIIIAQSFPIVNPQFLCPIPNRLKDSTNRIYRVESKPTYYRIK